MHAAASTNMIMEESDLLIVIGARFDDRAIGKAEKFCPNAKLSMWISIKQKLAKLSAQISPFMQMRGKY